MRRLISSIAFVGALTGMADAALGMSFDATVKDYFTTEWRASPTYATTVGVHDGDALLDDVSARTHAREAKRLSDVLFRLRAFKDSELSASQRDDRDVLAAQIDGQLLEELTIQQWRHNPASYVDLMTGSVYSLIERDFAPLALRLRNVIARERAFTSMLDDAKRNLKDMPAVFVDVALENLDGGESFLGKDVPSAFATVSDEKLRAQLSASTQSALAALSSYKTFLTAQKPLAHGSFVLGRNVLQHLLASDLVDIPVDRVLAAGQAQLLKDRAAFLETERRIDPQNPAAALALLERDHPDGAHLVSTARDQLAMLQSFIDKHAIVTLPSRMLPTVAETPPFARALIFGEMDPPGALETRATKAYYFITPPDPHQSKTDQDKYLAYFNRALLQNLSVHEALPGHFVQYLFARANPRWTLTRKTAHSYTATEGWAHYSEQMMLDEHLGGDDPKLRLAQLQDALLRDCRLVASIKMHAGSMTLAQATTMMEQQCFQPASVAPKEARRGTSDPGYFSYTLGKLEILKLRADMQKKEGEKFSLTRFHDQFLAAGLVPIAIIRRDMLGSEGPAL